MAWPYTARDYTFSAGVWIPSSTLNEMEDRIVDLHRTVEEMVFINGFANLSAGDPTWEQEAWGTGIEFGWVCKVAGGNLRIPCAIPHNDAIVTGIGFKYYISAAKGMMIYAHKADLNATTTPPSKGAAIKTHDTTGDGDTPAYWQETQSVGYTEALADRQYVIVTVNAADVGDRFGGVFLNFQPLTATP